MIPDNLNDPRDLKLQPIAYVFFFGNIFIYLKDKTLEYGVEESKNVIMALLPR